MAQCHKVICSGFLRYLGQFFIFFFSAINDAIFNYKYFVVGINEQIKITQSMNTRVLCCLVPRPHYYARPMRFGSCGPRKFLRPRQTRRSETFCLTWGGAFGSGRAVNNFSALMKDVQQPWRVQRNEHFYSMHVFIVESRLAFLFH